MTFIEGVLLDKMREENEILKTESLYLIGKIDNLKAKIDDLKEEESHLRQTINVLASILDEETIRHDLTGR